MPHPIAMGIDVIDVPGLFISEPMVDNNDFCSYVRIMYAFKS